MAYGDYVRHQAVVTAWLSKAEKGLDNEQLVDLLELTLTRVMDAARLPAGEITLAAVLDRVVGTAADAFQWLPRTVVTAAPPISPPSGPPPRACSAKTCCAPSISS